MKDQGNQNLLNTICLVYGRDELTEITGLFIK